MLYKNAPIEEAVFDIRVADVGNRDLSSYVKIGQQYFPGFPKEEKRVRIGGQINITAQGQQFSAPPTLIGSIFSNQTGNRKVQIRQDGYSFNMLRPYTKWDDFFSNAISGWFIYNEHVKPKVIDRVALRYINNIALPIKDLDFDHYIKYLPRIPEKMPQVYNTLFLQMQIPCNTKGLTANVTQTFSVPNNDFAHFLLDIDVFRMVAPGDTIDLNEVFEEMRSAKNEIFESYITDKTRELFK